VLLKKETWSRSTTWSRNTTWSRYDWKL